MGGGSDVIRVPGRKSLFGPLACFSKSSVAMYPETTSHIESNGAAAAEEDSPVVAGEEEAAAATAVMEEKEEAKVEVILRSCIRKKVKEDQDQEQEKESVKGKVKWMDSLGKDLVVIKEYEASHYVDSDEPSCVCVIQ